MVTDSELSDVLHYVSNISVGIQYLYYSLTVIVQ
jgi:hypothetical protein